MNIGRFRALAGVATLGVAVAGPAHAQIPCRYEVTVLPNIDCGFGSYPPTVTAVNSHGHVVGHYYHCSGAERAVLWTGGPTWTHLPHPPGVVGSRAYDINDKNEIVGYMAVRGGFVYHAMLFRNGQMIDLGMPSWAVNAEAIAINNDSTVIGYCTNPASGPTRAMLWENGRAIELALPVGPSSYAFDINDASQITGFMGEWPISSAGFVWSRQDVEVFGPIPGGFTAEGRAIDSTGRVAGQGQLYLGESIVVHALVWHEGRTIDIGTLPGHELSYVWGMNDTVVVGHSEGLGANNQKAFVYRAGQMVPLEAMVTLSDNLPLRLFNATGVSDNGFVIADGFLGDDHVAVRLTPVLTASTDLDLDCATGMNDLLTVISEWGKQRSPADVNQDGIVGIADLLLVIQNWTLN